MELHRLSEEFVGRQQKPINHLAMGCLSLFTSYV